jgi:hypothetical protein
MIPDPTDEIRAIRDRLAAASNFDVDLIVEEARRHQAESGRPAINLPPSMAEEENATKKLMRAAGSGGRHSA